MKVVLYTGMKYLLLSFTDAYRTQRDETKTKQNKNCKAKEYYMESMEQDDFEPFWSISKIDGKHSCILSL